MESEPLGPSGKPRTEGFKGPPQITLSVTCLTHTAHTDLHWKVLHLKEWFSAGGDAAPGDISGVWRRLWLSPWVRGRCWHQVSRGRGCCSTASSAPDNQSSWPRTSMVPKRKLRPSRSPPIVLTGPRLRHPGAPGAMKMNNPQSQSSRQTEADSLQNSALHKQP